MSYNPESTVARPLLALATSLLHGPRRHQRRARLLLAGCGTLVLLVGSSYLYFGPNAGLLIPDRLAPYYSHPMFPGGNAPPPIDGPDSPSSHSSSNSDSPDDTAAAAEAEAHLPALLSAGVWWTAREGGEEWGEAGGEGREGWFRENGRDEPRVVFDVGPLFEALTLSDPTPFALFPPRTGAFFAQPETRDDSLLYKAAITIIILIIRKTALFQ
ncbi:hypothetical protein B0H13DRAFT_2434927 [Mycena leptocephala]|nr:hypothetical protein B0H13DRAFT_2434927 [Mycena leptocephala]